MKCDFCVDSRVVRSYLDESNLLTAGLSVGAGELSFAIFLHKINFLPRFSGNNVGLPVFELLLAIPKQVDFFGGSA